MDSELAVLDLAVAKALGFSKAKVYPDPKPLCVIYDGTISARAFSPSTDIAEAMRLAAERKMCIDFDYSDYVQVVAYDGIQISEKVSDHSDKLRACCVAICRAVIAAKERERG